MCHRPFPWPGINNLCWLKDGKDISVDGSAYGEVCSNTGMILLFQQLDDALAGVESSGYEIRSLFRSGDPSSDRILGQTSPKLQDYGIIPVDKHGYLCHGMTSFLKET